MSKEVSTKAVTGALTGEVEEASNIDAWGDNEMSAADLVIPKILPQQPGSSFVTDGAAKFGDFCNSLTGELIGAFDRPIDIVPIYMSKVWIISKKIDGQFKFDRMEAINASNENLSWNEVVNGVELKREYTRNFYVLIDGQDVPYVISMKGASARTGKILASQMYSLNAMAKLPPAGVIMSLGAKKEKKDNNNYLVLTVTPKGRTPNDRLVEALHWYKTIQTGVAKVDTSDIESKETANQEPAY